MKEIPLTKGLSAIVDDVDFDRFGKFIWSAQSNGGKQVYAYRKTGSKQNQVGHLLHRAIMGLGPYKTDKRIVDHIDGNPLNNRRSNLRITNKQGNAVNSFKRKGTSSQFKGVTWDASRKKWAAQIGSKNKTYHLGRFDSEKEAAIAYNTAAKFMFGEFVRVNEDM